jgi:hypothetical protein
MSLFFRFAATHSLLMGLLPFFIAIILWQQGFILWQLSGFVALTSLGFLVTLPFWHKLVQQNRWSTIIASSLILEVALVGAILWMPNNALAILIALINGAYLCFYWMTQRTLFTHLAHPIANSSSKNSSTGNNYGNFQLVVIVLLKVGIFVSAFLLDQGLEVVLFVVTLVINILAWPFLKAAINAEKIPALPTQNKPILFNKSTGAVFFVDGIFLYLESYFWLLSLYLIAQQDVMQLGLLVIVLTLLLAGLFWLLKSRIDATAINIIFPLAVIGYGISWLLRGYIGHNFDTITGFIYPLILLIAFLTSFFRLSFNKRFFDHANHYRSDPKNVIKYLMHKSYLSQWGILIFFSTLALLLATSVTFSDNSPSINIGNQLSWIYGLVAFGVLLYSLYAQPFLKSNKVDHHA